MLYYDESSYGEFLELSGSCAMKIRFKWNCCIEIYKTLNKLNQSFLQSIFGIRKTKRAKNIRQRLFLGNFKNPEIWVVKATTVCTKETLKDLWISHSVSETFLKEITFKT